MKHLIFALLAIILIACHKDDDPVSPYPVVYSFDRIDQTGEGLYLVIDAGTLSNLPTNIGLFGQFKDSLKTELQKVVSANIDINEIELTSDTQLWVHYTYQGLPVITPVTYTTVNGDIIIPDSLFNGIVSYDKEADQFLLCGATAFALPGPNAGFPFGPPYFQFNVDACIDDHSNKDYAIDLLVSKNLQPMDTIGVLVTKYIYSK